MNGLPSLNTEDKKTASRRRDAFDSKGIQPWTICEAIAEAGGLEFVKAAGRDLREAKTLKATFPDITVETVKAVVGFVLEQDRRGYWNIQQRITPAVVQDKLPLWRKALSEANGHSRRSPAKVMPVRFSRESDEAYRARCQREASL